MLAGPDPIRALGLMDELEVTAAVLPEFDGLRGVVQTPNHHLDVHGHTLAVLERLLEVEADLPRFAGDAAGEMAELLAEPLADELTRGGALRFGGAAPRHRQARHARDARAPRHLHRPRPGRRRGDRLDLRAAADEHASSAPTSRVWRSTTCASASWCTSDRCRAGTVYAYLKATEPVGADVTLLTAADRMAARGEGPIASDEMIEAHLELVREMLPEALAWQRQAPRPPLDGNELAAEIGLTPGPRWARSSRSCGRPASPAS